MSTTNTLPPPDVVANGPDAGSQAARQPSAPERPRRSGGLADRVRDRVPLWVGRALQVAGLFLLLTEVPRLTFGTGVWLAVYHLDALWLTTVPTVFNAGLLLVIGHALAARKRLGMWLAVGFFLPVVVSSIATAVVLAPEGGLPAIFRDPSGRDFAVAEVLAGVLALGLVLLILDARSAFTVRALPGSVRLAVGTVAVGFASAVGIAWLLIEHDPGSLVSVSDRWWWAVNTVLGSAPNQVLLDSIGGRPPQRVVDVVTTVSALGIAVAVVIFLRSSRARRPMSAEDELVVRGMVLTHDDDSLGYFATRRDRSVVFSPDGRAGVSYGVFSGVALACGDPVGDPARWPEAIDAWQRTLHRFGWSGAVLAASERGAHAYAAAGMSTVRLGDEAVVETATFSLSAPGMDAVRAAVGRCRRAGCTVTVRRAQDVPPEELDALRRSATAWRDGAVERGFSMALSRFGDASDGRYVVVTAADADGAVRGLLGLVPWGRRGLSLDLMRRSPDAVNGVTEAMISELLRSGPDLGVREVSLNFAVFREVLERGARIGAGRVERVKRRLVLGMSRFWQLDQLYRSNVKYQPRWRRRLLCHDPGLPLVRVVWAAARAEGFLALPVPSRHGRPLSVPAHTVGAYTDFVARVRALEDAVPDGGAVRRLTDQQRSRHANLAVLRAHDIEPFPVAVDRDTALADVVRRFPDLAPGTRTGAEVAVVGRVVGRRRHGGITFLDLREGTTQLQVVVRRDRCPRESLLTRTVDRGDLVSVRGEVVTTDRGALSVEVHEWQVAAKSLQPLPGARTGLTDPDTRVRSRHVDLALDTTSMDLLLGRSAAVRALRRALDARDFVEVETPILQAVHGGANARPFRTRINAYDMDLSLRIAPELALKRLCVGGVGRVFEIGRNFRNEGADATHNPEFTSVEVYEAYADYVSMRDLTRNLVLEMARAVHGEPVARRPGGATVRLDTVWPVIPVHAAVSAAAGALLTSETDVAEVRRVCRLHGVRTPTEASAGELVSALYEELVEPATQEPTFYTDFPVETSPLARAHRHDPRLAERWDLVAFGMELGTAYSELTDPVDQRERLNRQSLLAAGGDPEAMEVDEDFLAALEFGMPPTGGLGLGVDRLVMMLMGTTIRQSLAFPFVRPAGRRGPVCGEDG
jgi:lysyl-tRNA synthetase class 2